MKRDKAVQYFKLARYQARLFSKDPSTKVAALFLAPSSLQILSAGYNGFCRGVDETKASRWERPAKYTYVVHAEQNGICNAARSGVALEGCIAVVTLFPCCECAKALIQVGARTVVAPRPDYDDERWGAQFRRSMESFEETGVRVILLDDEDVADEDAPEDEAGQRGPGGARGRAA